MDMGTWPTVVFVVRRVPRRTVAFRVLPSRRVVCSGHVEDGVYLRQ